MAKTLHIQCRGPGFNPWSGNQIPHGTTKDPAWRGREERVGQMSYSSKSNLEACTLPCVTKITSGNLLYDSENSNWGSVTT